MSDDERPAVNTVYRARERWRCDRECAWRATPRERSDDFGADEAYMWAVVKDGDGFAVRSYNRTAWKERG